MAIDNDRILDAQLADVVVRYDERDIMLYALGIGFGRDPLDARELPFVYERELQTVPTFATVLGWRTMADEMGIDMRRVLHGEQRLQLMRPLPSSAAVEVGERVIAAFDKGVDKGAVLIVEKLIRECGSGDVLARLHATIVARADGGFGGQRDGAPKPHPLPSRPSDACVESATQPGQAFLYALSGDRNPIHRDPEFARRAGFERPILHGLCAYGIACRAVICAMCDGDASAISAFDVRFSAPVYPGETIVNELWRDGDIVSFRARVRERDVVVLDNGRCVLGFGGVRAVD